MKQLLLFVLLFLLVPSFVFAEPVQWTVESGGNGHWYEFVSTPMTFFQAQAFAEGQSIDDRPGYLATFSSEEEHDFVMAMVPLDSATKYGLYQPDGSPEPTGGWMWVTGEPVVWTNWYPGEPNNSSSGEKIAMTGTFGTGHQWNDMPDWSTAFVIEYNGSTTQPIQWSEVDGGNGHSYQLVYVVDSIDWEDAKIQAESMGGYLATITTLEENDWVYQNVVQPNSPVGVFDILLGGYHNHASPSYWEPDGGWEWVTGEPWAYEAWRSGEPNDGGDRGNYLAYASFSIMGWNDTGNGPIDPSNYFLVEFGEIKPYSLNFDGVDDYVYVANSSLVSGDQLSATVWYFHEASNTASMEILGTGNQNDYHIFIDDEMRVGCGVHTGNIHNLIESETILSEQGWYHVAMVYNGASLKLYLNGNPAGEMPATGAIFSAQVDNLIFGLYALNGLPHHGFLQGRLDEISIWERALSPAEIQGSMESIQLVPSDGLIGYWSFDEGVGSTAYDQSGNGHHGTIHGATWSEDIPPGNFLEIPYIETFDDGIADDFQVASGTWEVIDGRYRCYNGDSGTKNLSAVGNPLWSDYRVSMDVLSDGAPIQEFLFRYQDPENWYLFVVLPDPYNKAAIWKSTDGVQTKLLELPNIFNEAGVSHRLSVEALGNRFRAYLDSELLFTINDYNDPYLTGKIALSSSADPSVGWSDVSFDKISVQPIGMVTDVPISVHSELDLKCFPNPFNPTTTIEFNIPHASSVNLRIYDVSGKLVRNLISDQFTDTGKGSMSWDGKNDLGQSVSSGVYFYKLDAGEFSETKRMALVK